MNKRRYALIGASGRSVFMFGQPLKTRFSDIAEIVGIMDVNPLRAAAVKEMAGLDCPIFTDFAEMVTATKPDCGIVTTVDRYHHEYIIKCLESGIDAIAEKPMTIDADKCNAILEAERLTGRKVTVTFNYRFAPYATAIKQAIVDGAVGKVLNVDFEYMLDTSHGADYFRRWHRRKENSGGLLVHKSTHHFDLINWWIDDEPLEVMGFGTRRFYGPTRSERGERCRTCQFKSQCSFYFDIDAVPFNVSLYSNCEKADGYYRDRCVFADEIDIEDSMSINARYSGGALLSYSLIAHSPYEGYKASINGTDGRLEVAEYHSGLKANDPCYSMELYDRKGNRISRDVPKSRGGHGGGDEKLQDMIFRGPIPDPLGHQAGSYAGAVSILMGIAANKSIAEKRNVVIADLVCLSKYAK